MKKYLILLTVIAGVVYANLPPTSSKGGGESAYKTTFETNYDTIPVTRTGTRVTIGTIPPSKGGTGSTSTPTNGQIPIGNGTNYQAASITGTANQVSVTNGAGSITLSTPQDIATTSNVQFANLNATGTTTLNSGLTGPLKASSGVVSSSAINLSSEVTGTLPIANGGTGSATQNFVDLTTNQTVAGEKTFSNTLKSDSIQTTGSSGVVIKNSSGTTVAEFGPANTTNASIAGGLNVGGNVVATGTVTGSNLSGTNTGDTEIGNDAGNIGVAKEFDFPNSQVVQTDSTNKKFRIESGNNNELYNGGFEAETLAVGWTVSNATSSSSTTRIEGSKSLSLALTGALSLSQSSTINAAQKSGVQMVASIWVNSSDVSDLQLCSLKNGSEDKCTVTGGYVQGSGWRQLTVSFLGDSTSNGLKLKSTDTTGTVLVDQAYVGVGSPIVDFTPDMVYSAEIAATTGVVSKENTDFISGNCTHGSPVANAWNCPTVSGVFTTTPNCTAVPTGGGRTAQVTTLSTASNLTVYVQNISTLAFTNDTGFQIICQKQGADYKTSKAYVASSSDYGWTAYTPTFTGLGTVTGVQCYHKREGSDLLLRCPRFVVGTTDTTEARLSLPNSLVVSSSVGSTYSYIGELVRTGTTTNNYSWSVLTQPSVSYVTFGAQSTGTNKYTALKGSDLAISGETLGFFTVRIPIQGWTDSGVIVGSFEGYNETPGTSRVETFSVSYGTTNATTVCSASPCSYLDQIGNAVTSVTRSGTGVYSVNLSKTFNKIKCTVSTNNPGAFTFQAANGLSCSNCSSVSFNTANSAASAIDTYGNLVCQGIPQ